MIRRSLCGLVVLIGFTGCGGTVDGGSTATEYKKVTITRSPDGALKLCDGSQTVDFSSLEISGQDSAGTVHATLQAAEICCAECSCDDHGSCSCSGCGGC